jgi:hypothetical protein
MGKPRFDIWRFFDIPVFLIFGIVATFISVGILSIDSRDTTILTFASIIQIFYNIIVFIRLARLSYLLFNHSRSDDENIDIWLILDSYGAYLASNIMISYMIWFLDLTVSRQSSYALIGNAPAIDAYEKIFSYSLLLIGTGGFGVTIPTSAVSRIWSGIMITGSTLISVLTLGAAVSIILENRPKQPVNKKRHSDKV